MDFVVTKERIKDFFEQSVPGAIFDFNTVLENFLGHFRTKKFDYINGYTSSIVLFAKFCRQGIV
jgi:phenylacetate-CoA ligase